MGFILSVFHPFPLFYLLWKPLYSAGLRVFGYVFVYLIKCDFYIKRVKIVQAFKLSY